MIAGIEHNSTHPIGTAFKDYYDSNFKVNNFTNLSGMGISGEINKKKIYIGNNRIITKLEITNTHKQEEKELVKNGNSILYVIEDKKIIALIGVKDIVRENAKSTIKELLSMNKEIIMLSGDNEETANLIAKELGIKK